MGRILFLLVAAAGVFFILFQTIRFIFSISNPKSRVEKDRKFGLIKMRELSEGLVPFSADELELLSTYRNDSVRRKLFHSEVTGHLNTIYNERLAAYFLYDYLDDRKLLLTENTEYEVEIYAENKNATVWVNGKLKYHINPKNELTDISGQTQYGNLTSHLQHYQNITIGKHNTVHIVSEIETNSMQNRVYTLVQLENTQDAEICYVLTLFHLFFKTN